MTACCIEKTTEHRRFFSKTILTSGGNCQPLPLKFQDRSNVKENAHPASESSFILKTTTKTKAKGTENQRGRSVASTISPLSTPPTRPPASKTSRPSVAPHPKSLTQNPSSKSSPTFHPHPPAHPSHSLTHSQYLRLTLRHQNRVLKVRRWLAIQRDHRPLIAQYFHPSSAQIHHRLNRQGHPRD